MILPLKPFRLSIYLIVLVSLYIIVVSIANYLSDDGSDHYIFKLGGHTFSIPKNYYRNRMNNTDKSTSTRLALILPDMLPFSEKTRSEFEKLGYHNKIFIDLMNIEGKGNVETSYASFMRLGKHKEVIKQTEAPGLKMFTNRTRTDVFAYFEGAKVKQFYLCKEKNAAKSPSCIGQIDYKEGLYVKYYFSRDYIRDWKKVSGKIVKILDSILVPMPDN